MIRAGRAALNIAVLWLAALLLPALPAAAQDERIVAGLSQTAVSITTDFTGSEILIYGAVRRESPPPDGPKLEVIVTVEGPATGLIVRKKDRRAGIWLNTESVTIDRAPSFYAIHSTGPLEYILSDTENLRHRISINSAVRAVGISNEAEESSRFLQALLRIRGEAGLYVQREHQVALSEDTLFRADVELPADLTEGDYRVRIFLTRGGAVVDVLERSIAVQKTGLERLVYTMAQEQPLLYGLLALAMAVAAGWGASAAFRLIRN